MQTLLKWNEYLDASEWIKRIVTTGAFFLVKGLAWLIVPYIVSLFT